MIEDHSRIALTRAIPERSLVAGDVGTVVAVHDGGKGYTVEFLSLDGTTLAIETMTADAVRPVRKREIAHVRDVA